LRSVLWSLWNWTWLPDGWVGMVIGIPVAVAAGGLIATLVCRLIDDTYWFIRRRRVR
jgi:hypothetical protein